MIQIIWNSSAPATHFTENLSNFLFSTVTSRQHKQSNSLFSILHLKYLHQAVFQTCSFMALRLWHSSSLSSECSSSLLYFISLSGTDVIASFSSSNWQGFMNMLFYLLSLLALFLHCSFFQYKLCYISCVIYKLSF